jgi:spermidine synthase
MALWFAESASEHHQLHWRVRRVLHHVRSPYQDVLVLDTEQFGPALVLDGILQTTAGDEFIYHEMLALVPLATHPNPRRVLVIGGGDGGTAREVLAFPGVERVVMVEIDAEVVEAARRYLPAHTTALDDPRLELVYADGAAYLERPEVAGAFDVILVDATDPEGDGPGRVLYTTAFHQSLRRALSPGGLYVQHTGSPFYNPDVLAGVSRDVAEVFPVCRVYATTVPTYPGCYFTFTVGSTGPDPVHPAREHRPATARWYTPAVHRAAFALPPFVAALVPPAVRERQP